MRDGMPYITELWFSRIVSVGISYVVVGVMQCKATCPRTAPCAAAPHLRNTGAAVHTICFPKKGVVADFDSACRRCPTVTQQRAAAFANPAKSMQKQCSVHSGRKKR